MTLHRIPFDAFGTSCHVVLAQPCVGAAWIDATAAIDEVQRVERTFSAQATGSVVARLNRQAGGAALRVDDECLALLHEADRLHRTSGGLFDPTVGALRRAWNFDVPDLPLWQEVQAALRSVGWHRVERDGALVRLPHTGMALDLGALLRGYAVDRAAALLQSLGVRHGYVEIGRRDVHVIGPQPDGRPWPLELHDPRRPEGAWATVPVSRGGLSTSTDAAQAIVVGSRRYCDLLDPRSGWPVSSWRQVSVAAPSAMQAGALATVAMLARGEALARLAASGFDHLAIDAEGRTYARGAAWRATEPREAPADVADTNAGGPGLMRPVPQAAAGGPGWRRFWGGPVRVSGGRASPAAGLAAA